MRSCLIVGSGRSGTSMLGGTLAEAGYFVGDDLAAPTASNPKGYFESREVNDINERILATRDPWRLRVRRIVTRRGTVRSPRYMQRWLAWHPADARFRRIPVWLRRRIARAVRRQPFALKDPRFSYTWPAWVDLLPADARFVCVFRHPAVMARSVLDECARQPYLASLRIDREDAISVWVQQHLHIRSHMDECPERWRFLHFDQILDGSVLAPLSGFLDVEIPGTFADAKLNRTRSTEPVGDEAAEVYRWLCGMAEFR